MRLALAVLLAAVIGVLALAPAPRGAWAQTPATPPQESQPQESQQQQQTPTPPPTVAPEPIPLQQFPIQQPGRPPATPASPPSTTLPPWTPPVPPAPSQTNIPAPFPFATPGAPGALPAVPGFLGLSPGIPSAFRPTVATVRGATLEFHPTLRLAGEYSDNFFQVPSGAEDNFRGIAGPGFTLLLNGARTFGTLSATLDIVNDTVENSGGNPKLFPSMNAAIRYALTPRLSLTATDTFIRNDEASSVDRTGIRRGRQIASTNNFGLAVDWLLDQVATQAYYRNILFFNEDEDENRGGQNEPTSNRGDSITHILGVNAGTRFATDYLVRAGYEFSRSDNSGGSTTGAEDSTGHTVFASLARQFGLYATGGVSTTFSHQSDDNARVYNASLFGAYGLPTGLSLAASVGYSVLDSDDESNDGMVTANVTASYRFARAVISVGAFRDFNQTAQSGQNFGTVAQTSVFGSFLYQLTPYINTVMDVTYSENEPTGTGNVEGRGTEKTLTYGAALNWQMLRWLTASLRWTYTKQEGTDVFDQSVFGGNGNYAENRVSLNFFATF